jgi:hypothetical protein
MQSTAKEPGSGRFVLYDVLVGVLAVALVGFLLVTMGIRSQKEAIEKACKDDLLALAAAQQQYLVKNSAFAPTLDELRPFLEEGAEDMDFVCPISEQPYRMLVDAQRYLIVAPGTEFKIETGDPNW